ncbi:hypothetical protein ABZ766_26450 [Streptomyces sp. NPDC006670]|uniref:hypothetical protein n=1 Tax=Streptomyces sp. NPDC006670 TaxID=3154476 RepID=UPI0033E32388
MAHEQGRLLPWVTGEGQPCYLATDGQGYLSRVADDMERVQLGMAVELLGHADDMLTDYKATAAQLRYLGHRMAESLRDVHRIAVSRGARMAEPVLD